MSYIVNFKLDTKQHSWLWLISYSGSFVYFEWVNWAFFYQNQNLHALLILVESLSLL